MGFALLSPYAGLQTGAGNMRLVFLPEGHKPEGHKTVAMHMLAIRQRPAPGAAACPAHTGCRSAIRCGSRPERGQMQRTSRIAALAAALVCAVFAAMSQAQAQSAAPHNLILFVPDGLRMPSVNPGTAPAMATVRDRGVNFANPHALFPTFTTANA